MAAHGGTTTWTSMTPLPRIIGEEELPPWGASGTADELLSRSSAAWTSAGTTTQIGMGREERKRREKEVGVQVPWRTTPRRGIFVFTGLASFRLVQPAKDFFTWLKFS